MLEIVHGEAKADAVGVAQSDLVGPNDLPREALLYGHARPGRRGPR